MLVRFRRLDSLARPHHRHRPSDRARARFRLEWLEDRCLLSGISSITEFPIDSNVSNVPYQQIVTGPDGNIWFTQTFYSIGMINPTTHAITQFTLPGGNYEYPGGMAAGPDGNIWFTDRDTYAPDEGDEIGMINPTTHAITEFTLHSGATSSNWGITAGPDGNLWFTDTFSNAIGMINPTTHVITEFTLPTAGAYPWGIVAGPDGNLWFTEADAGQIGEINPTTHAITEFATPTANSAPERITAGPGGNLWFAEVGASQIGEINPTTHAISEFASPTGGAHPDGITAGSDGNLWFTDRFSGRIGDINPTTDAITEFPIPYTNADPLGITSGPDGNLWFTDSTKNAIGVAILAPTQFAVTQQPPAGGTAGTPFGLTVEDVDSSGNLVSSFDGTVTVGLLNPPGGVTLGGTLSVTASDGVATFSGLALDTAGSGYTLLVTSSAVGEAVTNAISVAAAAPSQVVVTQQPPAGVTAGSDFSLQATIEDPYGNLETGDSATVTVALANNPGGTTLGGTLSLTASQGVVGFGNLTLTRAASGYTLAVSSSGLSGATSGAITVTPAAASQLVITQQPPASVKVNTGFGLAVAIEDAYGNLVTSASKTVKVAFFNNPTGAKLGGTVSVASGNGVATFSGLTISKVGSGYTLQLTSTGLTSATTNAITVTASSSAVPAVTGAPDTLLAPLVLDSPDFWDGLPLKKGTRSR